MAVRVVHASLKGGSGKTTTAVQVACALAADGEKVLLLDLDGSGSASASEFNRDRELTNPELVNPMIITRKDGQGLEAKVDAFGEDYEWIIIDCPPENARLARRLMLMADLVVLPVIPTPQVVKALRKRDEAENRDDNTLDTFSQAQQLRPELKLVGVVTNYDARQSLQTANLQRARGYIEEAGGRLLDSMLTYICPYNEAWEFGLGVVEIKARTESEKRAQREVTDLVKNIKIALEEEIDGEQGRDVGGENAKPRGDSDTEAGHACEDSGHGRRATALSG